MVYIIFCLGSKEVLRLESLLELQDISKSFYGVKVLKNVNFDLRKGEVHALLGENGAGKSTLIKILSGAYKLDSGRIIFKGGEIHSELWPKKSRRSGHRHHLPEFSSDSSLKRRGKLSN